MGGRLSPERGRVRMSEPARAGEKMEASMGKPIVSFREEIDFEPGHLS